MEIGLITLSLAIMLFSASIIYMQAKQIDRLTDRLMARSYTEYVAMQPQVKTVEPQKRDPLSWYDDADIEDAK